MKTTTVEINDELVHMFVNFIDAGMKHPELGGARLAVRGAMCLQWLGLVQQKFAAMGNGTMSTASEVEEVKETSDG